MSEILTNEEIDALINEHLPPLMNLRVLGRAIEAAVLAKLRAGAEPVARMLHWCGPEHYSTPYDGTCARTFVELPKDGANSYWSEGEALYAIPAPVQGAVGDALSALDKGPWKILEPGKSLNSDDFNFDVRLTSDVDFGDPGLKAPHLATLRDRLNGTDDADDDLQFDMDRDMGESD